MQRPAEVRGDDFYLAAFSRLGTTRQFHDGGFGPLPWTAVCAYATDYGLTGALRGVFCDVLLLLDVAYRDHVKKFRQKEAEAAQRDAEKAAGAGAKGPRRRK